MRTVMLAAVRDTYLLAYDLALQGDLSREYRPLEGLRGLVSYEAGNAYIRLWQSEDQIPPAVQEKIAGIKANVAKLEMLPMGPITPIVFGLKPNTSLAKLLAPKRIVRFDLDGDGVVEQRPWLKATTGLLVWDGSSPMHASGVRLRDGRTLPSYDWIAPAVSGATTSRR